MSLTNEQLAAIAHISGDLQLIACAGSGKTEVVALRIANLLAPKAEKGAGLTPSNIVAFTFTEKAAAELKKRVIEKCRERLPNLVGLAEMYIGTIHGYPTLREIMRKSATGVVQEYIKVRQSEFDKIEFSEKAIEVSIGDGVSVSGRIDLVRRRDTDEIAIVDLKSNKDAQAPELTDSQLNIYALGYRELTGQDADYLETYQLDNQKRVARSVHNEDIEFVKGQIKSTANALRKKEFPPKPSTKACGRCDFCRMCSAGSKILAGGAS